MDDSKSDYSSNSQNAIKRKNELSIASDDEEEQYMNIPPIVIRRQDSSKTTGRQESLAKHSTFKSEAFSDEVGYDLESALAE